MLDTVTKSLSDLITAASHRLERGRPAAVRRRIRAVVYGVSAGLLISITAIVFGSLVTVRWPNFGTATAVVLLAYARSIMLASDWLQKFADDDL